MRYIMVLCGCITVSVPWQVYGDYVNVILKILEDNAKLFKWTELTFITLVITTQFFLYNTVQFWTPTGYLSIHVIPPSSSASFQKWAIKFLLKSTIFYQDFENSLIWMKNFLTCILYTFHKPPWNQRKVSLMPPWNLACISKTPFA